MKLLARKLTKVNGKPQKALAKLHQVNGKHTALHPDLSSGQIFIICFAKIIDDKESGVHLAGVHFGGAADSQTVADMVMRDCINHTKGGTVLVKAWRTTGMRQLIPIMQLAHTHFASVEERMRTTASILDRNRTAKWHD